MSYSFVSQKAVQAQRRRTCAHIRTKFGTYRQLCIIQTLLLHEQQWLHSLNGTGLLQLEAENWELCFHAVGQ